MKSLAELRETLPEAHRDIKLNLENVLTQPTTLTPEQRHGVAVASAAASRHAPLTHAILTAARAEVSSAVIEDALAAASLMAMNNVFYRFRHLVQKQSYESMPARLRMTRIARPATNKADFELFCLAVSAVNNCETCVRSHEDGVIKAGLSENQVQDALRVAATLHGAAVALELAELPDPELAATT
jgi:alkyl hydroperoxide reductase subunit D